VAVARHVARGGLQIVDTFWW